MLNDGTFNSQRFHGNPVNGLYGAGVVRLGTGRLRVTASGRFSGEINGEGMLEKADVGTLNLTGVANHTGGTLVSGGTLVFDPALLSGSVVNQRPHQSSA